MNNRNFYIDISDGPFQRKIFNNLENTNVLYYFKSLQYN